MNQEKKELLNFRYSRISEIAYYSMLIVVIVIIFSSTAGTFLIRKATSSEIILIPDNIYKFIIDVLGIFVLPVSVKIGGEVFVQALKIWKGQEIHLTSKDFVDNTQEIIENPTEIQKKFKRVFK